MKIINLFLREKKRWRKKINSLLLKSTRWLEKNFPMFAKLQNWRRFKKFDTTPSPFGINSHTNPHVYKFLIDCQNWPCLTNFELTSILIIFSYEKFSTINEAEFTTLIRNIDFCYMREDLESLRQEMLVLYQGNRNKYLGVKTSFKIFDDIVSGMRHRSNPYQRDEIRNVKRFFCELRHLLKNHILDPSSQN